MHRFEYDIIRSALWTLRDALEKESARKFVAVDEWQAAWDEIFRILDKENGKSIASHIRDAQAP